MLPDISKDGLEGNDELSNNFFMYIFKVQACPKRGAHDWSSCPYAHPKEKARRRDPRVYKYASSPCPESLKGINCGRGVDCPYAHSVYEYWLHPGRFRTQMCKKGSQCNRTLCFFAHSASELRFPDTQDDLEAAAVDAAAASASATPLPLCTGSSSLSNSQAYAVANGSVTVMPAVSAGSSFGMHSIINLGQVGNDGSSGHYGVLQVATQGGAPPQQQQQVLLQADALGSCYGGSDHAMHMPSAAARQPNTQSISDSLPRVSGDASAASNNPAAWLQMAAAAQLTGNQIMSQISRPPGQQQLQLQLQAPQVTALMPTVPPSMDAAYAAATGMAPAPQSILVLNKPATRVDNADMLVAGLANIGLVDDSSGSSSCVAAMPNDQYLVALNATVAGPSYELGMLQHHIQAPQHNDNVFLLQQLQQQQQKHLQHQQQLQQHQLLSSVGSGVSQQSSGSVYVGSVGQQPSGNWLRMV